MRFLYAQTRKLRRWIESLDQDDDEYFGYGNDNSVAVRRIARTIKRLFVPPPAGAHGFTGPSLPSDQNSSEENVPSGDAQLPAESQVPSPEFEYLPFALPGEIRVHRSADPVTNLPDSSLRTIGGRWLQPLIQWWRARSAHVAGFAIGVAIMHLLVVRPMLLQIGTLHRELLVFKSTQTRLVEAEEEIAELKASITNQRHAPVTAEAPFSPRNMAPPRDNSRPVPDPYDDAPDIESPPATSEPVPAATPVQ